MPTVHYHAGFTAGAVGSHEAVDLLEPVLHETLVVRRVAHLRLPSPAPPVAAP